MDEPTLALTAVTGTVGLVLLGLLIWGIRSGQFRDVEEAKYQVFASPGGAAAQDDGDETESTTTADTKTEGTTTADTKTESTKAVRTNTADSMGELADGGH